MYVLTVEDADEDDEVVVLEPEPAVESELRSVAARPGKVVMAVTPEVLEVAKLTPTGSVPFCPLTSMNPKAVTCQAKATGCHNLYIDLSISFQGIAFFLQGAKREDIKDEGGVSIPRSHQSGLCAGPKEGLVMLLFPRRLPTYCPWTATWCLALESGPKRWKPLQQPSGR